MENDRATSGDGVSGSQAVYAVIRFLRILRYRKRYVLIAIAIFGVLGGLYYFTATRIYAAKASLQVNDLFRQASAAVIIGYKQGLVILDHIENQLLKRRKYNDEKNNYIKAFMAVIDYLLLPNQGEWI